MVQFKVLLESEKGINNVPLAPFKGNRFNILFYNAAGVYYLKEYSKGFFERVKDENMLLSAVHWDL